MQKFTAGSKEEQQWSNHFLEFGSEDKLLHGLYSNLVVKFIMNLSKGIHFPTTSYYSYYIPWELGDNLYAYLILSI